MWCIGQCAFAVMDGSPERDENGLNKDKRKAGGCNQRMEATKKKKKAGLYQSEVAKFMVPNFTTSRCPHPPLKKYVLIKQINNFRMCFKAGVLLL